MRRPVAIASRKHRGEPCEAMRPDVEAYAGFFDLLRAEGYRTKGMFYADTVAGLLAWREVHARDAGRILENGRLPRPAAAKLYDANDSAFDPMG